MRLAERLVRSVVAGAAIGVLLAVLGSLVDGRSAVFFSLVGGTSFFVLCAVSPSANPWLGVSQMSIVRAVNAGACSIASFVLLLATQQESVLPVIVDSLACTFFFFAGMKVSDIWVRRVFK
jgi:hypothetical protein